MSEADERAIEVIAAGLASEDFHSGLLAAEKRLQEDALAGDTSAREALSIFARFSGGEARVRARAFLTAHQLETFEEDE